MAPSGVSVFASVTRLHIVAIAVLGTATFGWLFTGEYPWLLAAICGLDWFIVNLLNRVVDLPEDRANAIVGTGFVGAHRGALMWLGFGTLGLSFVATHLLVPEITWARATYHLLGITYNWPLLPGGRRIKTLYFWKNTASGMGFVITVFLYPLAAVSWGTDPSLLAPGITGMTILLSGLFFVAFELSYEVIYDLRDAAGDAIAGVRSYAVVHGESGAMRIADGLLGLSVLNLTSGFTMGIVPWRIFVMVVGPFLQLFLYKRAMSRGIQSADCVRLTWIGAGLLLTYQVWVLLDLPGV